MTMRSGCFIFILLISLILIVWKCMNDFGSGTVVVDIDYHATKFNIYLVKYGKSYNETEYFKRLEHFKASSKEIARLNKIAAGITRYGFTKFADMSQEEFETTMLRQPYKYHPRRLDSLRDFGVWDCKNKNKPCNFERNVNVTVLDGDRLPPRFDWREKGVVGPVLEQKGICQACWAFSSIGVMESMYAQHHAFTRLSIQELMDYQEHCDMSNVELVVKWLCNNEQRIAITTEKEYPLTQRVQGPQAAPRTGWLLKYMGVRCEQDWLYIARLVAGHGPLVTLVNTATWQYYLEGVIQFHCDGSVDSLHHVTQIVGYDLTAEVPYFLIRNSWGRNWGANGYVKIAMTPKYVCGVGRQIIFLDVKYGTVSDDDR